MRVGWIYPHREKCGIALYSRDFIHHLSHYIHVTDLTPVDFILNRRHFLHTVHQCDLIHVQYDTTVFFHRNHDFFPEMMKHITQPVIVTIHDIYKQQPGIFPRNSLTGFPPLKKLREILYDLRHPLQTSFNRHRENHFYTRYIHLHHAFHKEYLPNTSAFNSIYFKPLPVKSMHPSGTVNMRKNLELGALGFINPLYNYELLFNVLTQLNRPWRFTWIGGLRSDEQRPILNSLEKHINASGWNDRFTITGWVTEQQLDNYLSDLNMVLALFTERSTSASIGRALGADLPVIASRLPLTEELVAHANQRGVPAPILVSDANPSAIVDMISRLATDKSLQRELHKGINAYKETCSLSRQANEFIDIYREIAGL